MQAYLIRHSSGDTLCDYENWQGAPRLESVDLMVAMCIFSGW
jgi:hypothetical protein